jgi:hypothetical protein
MSPKDWGPPIWALFHTMAEKIKEEHYSSVYIQLFSLIKQICRDLPCPDCANHATQFLNKVNLKTIANKNELRMMLFVFHNSVNRRKGLPIYESKDLEIYQSFRLPEVFRKFALTYNAKTGNLKLMSDSLTRRQIIVNVSNWFKQNLELFDI